MHCCNSIKKIFFLLGLGLSSLAFGQDVEHYGRVESMGQAGAANPGENTAITLSPATLGLRERYELQTNFWITGGPDYSLSGSIADSTTSAVALGIVYHRTRSTGGVDAREFPGWVDSGEAWARRKRYDNVTLALAYPMLENRLSIGINGTLAVYNHDVQGKGVTGNIDFAVAGRPVESWALTLVGRNLLPISGCKPNQRRACIPDFDSGILIGSHLGKEDFGALALDVDIHLTQQGEGPPVSVRTGFEKLFSKVNAQIGYRWEGPTQEHWITTGVGMMEKNTGLHYALSIPLHSKPFDPLAVTHMLSLRVAALGSNRP